MTGETGLVAIRSEALSAEIDPDGAQLFSLKDASGRDLLWNGDPTVWNGRAPILFPIIGMLSNERYRLDGKTYSLPKHGFARRKRFDVVEAGGGRAVFRLEADTETLAQYPFQFTLELAFTIERATLSIAASVSNRDDRPMPASFGFHPALRWPLPCGRDRSIHRILFDQDEPSPIRRIDGDGLLRPDHLPTPVDGRVLVLRDDLFVDDALIFDQLRSQGLSYGAPDGPQMRVEFPQTPYLGVWTKPGAGFICIEPWHGLADPQGYAGDFRRKPGVFEVDPGAVRTMTMAITLTGQ